ncbi:ABC transporter ATP-binding protein [Bizionia sediminis]|uniref:ABC transporter ATP-binding protein n=1 Tax=Bizionia sediminis TaxID=1737064 RepID=A0ABW5KPI1_9FLAO
METILSISNLTKKYGFITALNQVSFTIKKGEVYGILGPNGSGKSTTLGIVLQVVNKTSGHFEWFGGNYSTHEALKKVGAIIERPNFYPYMSAYNNLKLVCKIKGVPESKIDEKLALVKLLDRKNSKFQSFSLGMKQRLAIASALLNDPEILILDEPTNGLDPQGIYQIRSLIKQIASQGTTILLASHLLDEVEKVCSHVVILNKGKKLYAGPVDQMASTYGYVELQADNQESILAILKAENIFGAATVENGLVKAYLKKPVSTGYINQLFFNQGVVLNHLVARKETLEEQFLKITDQL